MPRSVPLIAFAGQRPGTSGLRKKVQDFQQPGYVAAFLQAIFDTVDRSNSGVLVIGGDGRFYNREMIQDALRIAAANGFNRLIVGKGGLLSTPAASHLIRSRAAIGGLIFSASHNPGGPNADAGIKFNMANGGPAPENVTDAIYARTQTIDRFYTLDDEDIDLDHVGERGLGDAVVEVIDPVAGYADLMESLIDFAAIRVAVARGLTFRFDAMHAVTGPYAREIFERRLGFPVGTVVNGTPLPDFGGGHPDPNPVHLHALHAHMSQTGAPDVGAASDGDGDRNLVMGRRHIVTPSDSLAVLAAHARVAPGFSRGLTGVARSMPTSAAVDRVAQTLGLDCYETPTGWKFFGSLLDAGLVNLCGEESAGAGSDHIREKDGLWAVLMWLNILAATNLGVDQVLEEHWRRFGRNYYSRHDYEGVNADVARQLMADLEASLPTLSGRTAGRLTVETANVFSYRDPTDESETGGQGLRLLFKGGSRAILRLSGTGTEGATLRVYLEHYSDPDAALDREVGEALADLAESVEFLAELKRRTGRGNPDVVT